MNLKIVMKLRETIKNRVTIECQAAGVNKQRVIQRAPVRGRSNVIMFVGLQVERPFSSAS